MEPVSVAVITFNEGKNLRRCLRSVQKFADEIVVLDSGSTDDTEAIAREMGAKWASQPFKGHIQQKNDVLGLCRNDLVLSLDADEEVSPELASSVMRALETPAYDAYGMNRLTNYCGSWIRHGGWYPDTKLRLFRRSKGAWTGINPHDEFKLHASNGKIGSLSGDLLHYSYTSVSDHVRQIDYFTDISSRELYARGKKAPIWRILIAPPVRFVRDFLLRGGFLDGFHGFLIAALSSAAVLIKYSKLRDLRRKDQTHA